jgi:Ca-activated chloride channel family protein
MGLSFSFAHPWLLALLALPVLLLGWVWRRSSRRVALPFDHGRRPRGRAWGFLVGLAESLPALILAVVILILAGPQRLSEPKSKRVLTNIEFCVDISGSMTASFGEGSRYDASMRAIDEFLNYRQGDAFGLTFFGNNVLHWVPLTSDVSAVRCAPPFMRPESVPPWFGGTAIGKALLACKNVLEDREQGDRMIVLVSDGGSADLHGGSDEEVAAALKKANIAVYTIHTAEGEPPPEIINITSKTGGQAFAAGDPEALNVIFKQIDDMNKARLEKTAAETMDNFEPFCIAGLSLLGLTGLTLLGLRYTPW